jgi:sulfite exporter TauE/SafE
MIELPFVFVAGLLGSAHCLGMCGPFAVAIGARAATWRANLVRQCSYTLGRIFTYSFLGAVAGYSGRSLAVSSPAWVQVPAVLSIAAGVLLVYQGLATAGMIPRWNWPWMTESRHSARPCLAAGFFGSYLTDHRPQGAFLAGLFTGFLPCGLVYAFLTLAASSANLFVGAATMAVFGLGTSPIMIMTGWGGMFLRITWRQRLLQVAAWCVVIAGVISVGRGLGFLGGNLESAACPFCLS